MLLPGLVWLTFCSPRVETYHMIDTCDPSIATWSEDGLAFVVKEQTAAMVDRFLKILGSDPLGFVPGLLAVCP